MPDPAPPRALYAAFDRFPSSKGAAVHIGHAAATLFERFGPGLLHVLGGPGLPAYQVESLADGHEVQVVRFHAPVPNLLERAVAYGDHLARVAAPLAGGLAVVHGRDPWSVAPLLDLAPRPAVVYEVNGLPSVELAETHPSLPARTIERLAALERRCLAAADLVVTPSAVLAGHLPARGASPERIHVVPNGADLPAVPPPRPPDAPDRYLVYVGALQPWQGLPTAAGLRPVARPRRPRPRGLRLGAGQAGAGCAGSPAASTSTSASAGTTSSPTARWRPGSPTPRSPRPADRLRPQRRSGVLPAQGARVDGRGDTDRGVGPAGRARAAHRRRARPPGRPTALPSWPAPCGCCSSTPTRPGASARRPGRTSPPR
ncbi:MAG: glycosyltransferase [Acidimicrobiales bacterium]